MNCTLMVIEILVQVLQLISLDLEQSVGSVWFVRVARFMCLYVGVMPVCLYVGVIPVCLYVGVILVCTCI